MNFQLRKFSRTGSETFAPSLGFKKGSEAGLLRPIELRMVFNPQDASVHLVLESSSPARASFFVVHDRIEKLTLSFLNKADHYGDSRFSASRITSS